MSLKELTAEKHTIAESTPFMKAVFAKTLSRKLWIDWTFQKSLFYGTIEHAAGELGLLKDLPDIRRAEKIQEDYLAMNPKGPEQIKFEHHLETTQYHAYIRSIKDDPKRIMAHLYTWHMGDLFGGQMIKKIVDAPHSSLEFEDPKTLMTNLRAKLDDSMGDEANIAFDWAIRMMREYDRDLG
jgi:heme oxygenase